MINPDHPRLSIRLSQAAKRSHQAGPPHLASPKLVRDSL